MSQEKRRFTRVSFDSDCYLLDGDVSTPGNLLDISLKGALISLQDVDIYQPDKTCGLKIALYGSTIEMTVDVRMVHQQAERIGLQFISIDVDSLTHLRKLIELNMGDAEKTLKELFLWSNL